MRDVERLFSKALVADCWHWTASTNSHGYGQFSAPHLLTGKKGNHLAHRRVWEILVGPIPEGLQLDHLCRNRACVNPDHLEPVTRAVNVRRGAGGAQTRARRAAQTHCKRGHSLDRSVVYINPKGQRICRPCRAAHARRYKSPEYRTYLAGGREALLELIGRAE